MLDSRTKTESRKDSVGQAASGDTIDLESWGGASVVLWRQGDRGPVSEL